MKTAIKIFLAFLSFQNQRPKQQNSEFLKLIILSCHYFWCHNWKEWPQYDEPDLNKSQKSRVKIDGFLYPNIFLINNQHSLKSYQLRNIEKISKGVFFRLTTFFSGTKIFFPRNNFCSVFMYCKAKKNFGVIRNFLKFFDFLKL